MRPEATMAARSVRARITGIVLAVLPTSGVLLHAQSPHGPDFRIDCSACHVPDSWTVMRDPMVFDHDTTGFPLLGAHTVIDCRQCHASVDFSASPSSDCITCHADVHAMTVGNDCARCHSSTNWLVDDIPELHEQNGFPLVGVHNDLACVDCHTAANTLAFLRIGNECINCHEADYMAASAPNHVTAGFSTDCTECHDPFGSGWSTSNVAHDFFPLTFGHDIQDCSQCHVTGNFSDASPECVSCHLDDYNSTVNPDHQASGFSTDCATCHSTVGWSPANFDHDAAFFPIYSGTHNGQWSACVECHPNPMDFSVFSCTGCHTNPQTNNDHNGIPGYVYESTACLTCHPTGEGGNFDHNTTDFPLQGQHVGVACIECHAGGFTGTPTNCDACHMDDYNATTGPNHAGAQFPTDCAQCHNENGWTPASFDHDGQYFPIYSGNHAGQWSSCATCHTNSSDYSVFDCLGCHNDQAQLADDHSDEPGYTYSSAACFSCHPNGN